MNTPKKVYYAIRNKEGQFFSGWEGKDLFKPSHYYLYDLRVAQSRIQSISDKDLEIVVSPVQDDSVWDESNPYTSGKKR